ncbi:hypothetical protein ACFO5R_14420 [Halosolutus amylolyticus]|uniref:Uncharacterized protein n=1 Tax=Halosolutus amylolyticus TaxID=2932267 RepID=A0ABD5PT59_9EURY|nr:hypothetical protein [Halosolutus amylolyticus]
MSDRRFVPLPTVPLNRSGIRDRPVGAIADRPRDGAWESGNS